eukprot:8606404-Pyramimonas_sp.AAC.2
MLSHCWRGGKDIQELKRHLISTLGLNGLSYWGDFLDLQAQGPIPWRKEIQDAIKSCAKVVMFIDKEWLLSANCLQVGRSGARDRSRPSDHQDSPPITPHYLS